MSVADSLKQGYSWPITSLSRIGRIRHVTVTIIAYRRKRNNRGNGNSMRNKKRALSRYK